MRAVIGAGLCAILLLSSCGGHKEVVRPTVREEYHADMREDVHDTDTIHDERIVDVLDDEPLDEPALSNVRLRLIEEARSWIGVPYRYGGKTRAGTDCSGFVSSVYREVTGIILPRSSREQCKYCRTAELDDLLPGDLLFFVPKKGKAINHVGLYTGNGRFIHATSRGVLESGLDEEYYVQTYYSCGVVPALDENTPEE